MCGFLGMRGRSTFCTYVKAFKLFSLQSLCQIQLVFTWILEGSKIRFWQDYMPMLFAEPCIQLRQCLFCWCSQLMPCRFVLQLKDPRNAVFLHHEGRGGAESMTAKPPWPCSLCCRCIRRVAMDFGIGHVVVPNV